MKPPKRVLFLSTSMPPFAESQTIRNVFLLRGLARHGFSVDAITGPDQGGDRTLEALLPESVTVTRTRAPLYDRVQGRIARLPAAGTLRHGLRAAVAIVAGKLMVPDVRRGWDRLAVGAVLRRFAAGKLERPDLIVSSTGSVTAHLAASRLAAFWGAPWLAEYGDPWSHNPLPPASHWYIRLLNERLERRAMRHVTAISVTTEQTAETIRSWWGAGCPTVRVFPCGYSLPTAAWRQPGPGAVAVVYAGTAGSGSRDLRAAMQALDHAAIRAGRAVSLQLVGSVSPAFLAVNNELAALTVSASGWVSYAESVERMRAADLLLLIGNRQPLQVPGKVFNYLASGRPIVYWGQMAPECDPTLEWLGDMPGVVVAAPGGEPGAMLAGALEGLDTLARAARDRASHPRLGGLEWDRIGDRFAELAESTAASAAAAAVRRQPGLSFKEGQGGGAPLAEAAKNL
jgi:hypothetical protein